MQSNLRVGDDGEPLALIVDRDDDSRQLYSEYLQLNRWRVVAAAGGPEGLALAIAERPDVVVTETHLPGFDGVMLSELLRKDFSTAHIPVIFVTSDATPANLAHATAAGAQAVLTKPCFPESLMDALQQAIRRARSLREQSTAMQARARTRLARAQETIEQLGQQRAKRLTLKKALARGDTVVPPIPPPSLKCPNCDRPLRYLRSHLGGVNLKLREQWDYFECAGGCGGFEYRVRTRKLKQVPR